MMYASVAEAMAASAECDKLARRRSGSHTAIGGTTSGRWVAASTMLSSWCPALSGVLVEAPTPQNQSAQMAFQFQISAKMLHWPRKCACCCEPANASIRASASKTNGKRVRHTTTSWWEVPYCATCLSHKRAYEAASWWLIAGSFVGLAVWLIIAIGIGSGLGGFVPGALMFGSSIWPFTKAQAAARAQMKPTCCTPAAAVCYLGWYGTFHTFQFCNEAYTDEFLQANRAKNRSDVRRI